jgi:hypothetical protein
MTAEWQKALLNVMEQLVGPERAAKIAGAWNEHLARGKVEVTFLGPYSSGKSTLLRRLAVESGATIPDWLTVSARRETFELNALEVGDLTFTDAPGFGAGNELHDELAQDALALSDAFLLVVPPQLLTTDRELVGSIVSGHYFFGQPRPGSDQAVIAQADSMGIDPEDDLEAMRQLAERKRSELMAQLQDVAGIPLPNLQVFCVAADPYEEHARQPQPQRSDFDQYREWDGIDALDAALSALPQRYEDLLRAAEFRYYHRVGVAIASQAQAVVDELQASGEELRARQIEWEQQKARVDALVDAAKADLHATLLDLAGELGDEIGGDEAESRSHIDERVADALGNWAQRWDGELDLVLGQARATVDDRLGRVRALRTDEFLRSLTPDVEPTGAQRANSHLVELLNNINRELQGSARKTMEVYAGAPIEKLLAKGPRQASAAAAETAKDASGKVIQRARRLGATLEIANGVVAIASVIDADRRQQAADAQRARAREEARERVERNTERASAEIVYGTPATPGWRARADEALDQLRQQLGLASSDSAIGELMASIAAQQRLISDLRELLGDGR